MSGYTKLFNSILTSTIWNAPDSTRLVWITMLALADQDGIVEGSIPGLAHQARVSVDACRAAIAELESPDPDSRSQELDGRRIVAIRGGWELVNHAHYRRLMSVDDRRERDAARQRKRRAHARDEATSANTEEETRARDKSANANFARPAAMFPKIAPLRVDLERSASRRFARRS